MELVLTTAAVWPYLIGGVLLAVVAYWCLFRGEGLINSILGLFISGLLVFLVLFVGSAVSSMSVSNQLDRAVEAFSEDVGIEVEFSESFKSQLNAPFSIEKFSEPFELRYEEGGVVHQVTAIAKRTGEDGRVHSFELYLDESESTELTPLSEEALLDTEGDR